MSANAKRMLEIKSRKAELLKESETATVERMAEINKEADELLREETAIRQKTDLAGKLKPQEETRSEDAEKRAKTFHETRHATRQTRGLLLSGGKIAQPTEVQNTVNGLHEVQTSSLIDLIRVTDCTGMGSYKVPYEKPGLEAGTRTEGSAQNESDAKNLFDYVEMTPTMYDVLAYVSKDIRRQSPIDYETKVIEAVRQALRKKANTLAVTAILASGLNLEQSVSANKIDHNTLEDLILGYGGDDGIEGAAYLFLNKADLRAFAKVKGANEFLPAYKIVPDTLNPNTGVISVNNGLSSRYCLNSGITALSGATKGTTAIKTMFYGNPLCAEMAVFGDTEIEDSDGYKFAEGLLTIRGESSLAVDVTSYHGFSVLTLAKTSG